MAKLKMLLKASTKSLAFQTLETLFGDATIIDTDNSYGSTISGTTLNITNPPSTNFYVTIEGSFNKIQFAPTMALLECGLTENKYLTDMSNMFKNCMFLTTISELDTSNVTNMSFIFDGCSNLTSVPVMNTSKVTNMSNMFGSCSKLVTVPELDTSNVTIMSSMFVNCSSLTTVPKLNTNKVTSMSSIFSSCLKLTSIPELNTSNVKNTSYMFYNCNLITSIPLLDTNKVTSMNYMFMGCKSLITIPLLDISNVTNMANIFNNCSSLKSVKLKGLKLDLDLTSLSLLDSESVHYLLNSVQEVNKTITFNENSPGYLDLYLNDDAYMTSVTNKGFTINPAIPADKVRKSNYKVEYYYDGIKDDSKTETYIDIPVYDNISSYNDKIKNDYLLEKTENYPLTITRIENDNIIKVYYIKNNPFKVVYTDSLEKYNQIPNPSYNTMYIIGEGANEMIIFNNEVVSNKGATVVRL